MSKVLVGVKRVVDYSIKVRVQADKLGKSLPCARGAPTGYETAEAKWCLVVVRPLVQSPETNIEIPGTAAVQASR